MEKITQLTFGDSNIYKRIVLNIFKKIKNGHLMIVENGREEHYGNREVSPKVLSVINPNFYKKLVLRGEIGLGESYVDGDWHTDNLADFLKLIIDNQKYLGDTSAVSSFTKKMGVNILGTLDVIAHKLNHNSKENSLNNINYHYDLSNDFYKLWLDETMTYSSAIFENFDEDLKSAQLRKYDNLLKNLDLNDGDCLLEIGTGWGGLSKRAAEHFNIEVHTTTISKEQYEYAKNLFESNKLENVELHFRDYRDLSGKFNHIVSCEMIEAVGDSYLDSYFQKISSLLKKNGKFSMQAILMPSSRYYEYKTSSDWIRKYIFPGGHLPSIERLVEVAKKYDLELVEYREYGKHYGETLRRWRQSFTENLTKIYKHGFNEGFIRMWTYYLCICEAAFDSSNIYLGQIVFKRPNE